MCGICGLRKFGDEPIEERHINMLLLMNERRGNHATGVAIQNEDGEVHVFKTDDPATSVVASHAYKTFLKNHLSDETKIVIGHTRWATQGTSRKNENNHPVFAGETAVVHNGMISNDYGLFTSLKLERKAEVDTDIIRALLDEKGLTPDGGKALTKLCGSAAIAAISNKYPGKLLLGRSGSPLVVASTENNLMIWSSEKVAIHTAMRPYIKRFGFMFQKQRSDLAMLTMHNDSVYLFGEKGLEWHDSFNTARSYTTPNYKVHENYRNGRNKFSYEDGYEAVLCGKCNKYLLLTADQKKMSLHDLICRTCKTPLALKN